MHTCERVLRARVRVCATRECPCVCVCVRMYVRAGGACADVRVPVYLVVYVYYMTPFYIVKFFYSLNITVIIIKSVFLYYDLLGIFCHYALCIDQPPSVRCIRQL